MWDKKAYIDYLSETRKSEGTINEYIKTLEKFHGFIDQYRNENPGSSDIAAVEAFFETYNVPHMYSVFKAAIQCLREYADYLLKTSENPELLSIAEAIKETFANRYTQKAVDFMVSRKKLILPIPENAQIEPKYLSGLENNEFVAVFRELQNLIVSIYNEIEKSPFDWGFPDIEQSDGLYNRVTDILFGFVRNGIYNDGKLMVDTKAFAADDDVKKHKKRELVIKNLENFGFGIEGYGNKNKSFEVTFPDNNNLLNVLNSYVNVLYEQNFKWITDEKYPCYRTYSRHKHSFSYRYIEKRALQEHEMPFLIELDYCSDKGKEALRGTLVYHCRVAMPGSFRAEPASLAFSGQPVFYVSTNEDRISIE